MAIDQTVCEIFKLAENNLKDTLNTEFYLNHKETNVIK